MASLLFSATSPSLQNHSNRCSLGEFAGTANKCSLKFRSCKCGVAFNRSSSTPLFMVRNQANTTPNHSNRKVEIFSGSAHPCLAKEIALKMGMMSHVFGKPGEVLKSVIGCDVYLVQPANLMELHSMIDSCKEGGARSTTIVIMPYAYTDRTAFTTRGFCSSDLLLAGMAYVDPPVLYVNPQKVIVDYLHKKNMSNFVVVSPLSREDASASSFCKKLMDASVGGVEEVMLNVGVKEKIAILVEDIIEAKGLPFLAGRVAYLRRKGGAEKIYACATHFLSGVITPATRDKLSSFAEIIVTNSTPISEKDQFPQLTVLPVAELFAYEITRNQKFLVKNPVKGH